ncbi:cyclin-T1 isoform 3-T3 [Ammospiza maritima maritima]
MEASAGGGGAGPGRRWYFSREQLERSPSRRAGLDPDKELSYRQQAANLLQDMGQRLNVSQLTINTAIVYMHRFYMVQSFTQFHRNSVVPAALFLAAKVEEQPRKLEHVIKVAHACLHPQEPLLDTKSEAYLQQAQDLVILESIILQTLGFEITIDHPHTHVVKCTQLVRASKDLAQTSYFMATNRSQISCSKTGKLVEEIPNFLHQNKDEFLCRSPVTFPSQKISQITSTQNLVERSRTQTPCLQTSPTKLCWSRMELPVPQGPSGVLQRAAFPPKSRVDLQLRRGS